jgi:hypothetical protein
LANYLRRSVSVKDVCDGFIGSDCGILIFILFIQVAPAKETEGLSSTYFAYSFLEQLVRNSFCALYSLSVLLLVLLYTSGTTANESMGQE